jgi:hypothetical protein
MIIANTLKDGRVVFLGERGQWVNRIVDGLQAQNEFQAERLVQAGARAEEDNQVIAPELIKVTGSNSQLRPVEIREAIRAAGPTV